LYLLTYYAFTFFLLSNDGCKELKMAKANTSFDLDVRDVELIENALNSIITKQSSTIINSASNSNTQPTSGNCPAEINNQIAELRDLLGKLHNQKIWYRPKSQFAYVGG
jgi:hypothetical protein